MRIVTDAEDSRGTRSLYESVGFRMLKEHDLYRKPMKRAAGSPSPMGERVGGVRFAYPGFASVNGTAGNW